MRRWCFSSLKAGAGRESGESLDIRIDDRSKSTARIHRTKTARWSRGSSMEERSNKAKRQGPRITRRRRVHRGTQRKQKTKGQSELKFAPTQTQARACKNYK